jgi:hypothetical protein
MSLTAFVVTATYKRTFSTQETAIAFALEHLRDGVRLGDGSPVRALPESVAVEHRAPAERA